MFLRNCWQVAAFSGEVISGELLARTLINEPLVFYRTLAGKVVAMYDQCPHRMAPLSLGHVFGDTLQCGYHGACFDTSGKCISVPGQPHIPAKAQVKTYPVVERYKCVWIWMGEADKADPALIPDVHWMDDPNWVASTGYHHVKADYRLLNDNLLDLSHETYVHGKTIGNAAVAESPVTVRAEEDRVLVSKEMKACQPPPFYQHTARLSPEHRVDRWQKTTYIPPGYVVIDVGVKPLGEVPGAVTVNGQVIDLITPETETTSHYFWAFARDCRLEESAVTEYLREAVRRTFDEDKVMLEAQQARLGSPSDGAFPVAFGCDVGPTQGRRLLSRLIEAERAAAQRAA